MSGQDVLSPPWSNFVTVCVAAICDNRVVIGASDRMLTAGDIEFEPQQPKVFPLTTAIYAMYAGDSGLASEAMQLAHSVIREKVDAEPNKWLRVRDVAHLFAEHCGAVRRKRAEAAILLPLGLTTETFLADQQSLSPDLVNNLSTELISYQAPEAAAIFAGVDQDGAHIYVVENAYVTCHDAAGFAAIGAGYWHAESQMMFAKHSRTRPFAETLLLTYSAKKRAEVAPGVGEGTDMFMIGPLLGESASIAEHAVKRLDDIYKAERRRIAKARQKAEQVVKEYVEKMAAAAATTKEQGAVPSSDGSTPAAKEDAPDGTEN